jgi:hypothetical protein
MVNSPAKKRARKQQVWNKGLEVGKRDGFTPDHEVLRKIVLVVPYRRPCCSRVPAVIEWMRFLLRCISPLVCRVSDAGNDDLATRSGDRRPKSAKARNRGVRWCGGSAAGAMGI